MFYDFLTSISKKSGILTHNEMDSALVELVGFEPTSKQGAKKFSTCLSIISFRNKSGK